MASRQKIRVPFPQSLAQVRSRLFSDVLDRRICKLKKGLPQTENRDGENVSFHSVSSRSERTRTNFAFLRAPRRTPACLSSCTETTRRKTRALRPSRLCVHVHRGLRGGVGGLVVLLRVLLLRLGLLRGRRLEYPRRRLLVKTEISDLRIHASTRQVDFAVQLFGDLIVIVEQPFVFLHL